MNTRRSTDPGLADLHLTGDEVKERLRQANKETERAIKSHAESNHLQIAVERVNEAIAMKPEVREPGVISERREDGVVEIPAVPLPKNESAAKVEIKRQIDTSTLPGIQPASKRPIDPNARQPIDLSNVYPSIDDTPLIRPHQQPTTPGLRQILTEEQDAARATPPPQEKKRGWPWLVLSFLLVAVVAIVAYNARPAEKLDVARPINIFPRVAVTLVPPMPSVEPTAPPTVSVAPTAPEVTASAKPSATPRASSAPSAKPSAAPSVAPIKSGGPINE